MKPFIKIISILLLISCGSNDLVLSEEYFYVKSVGDLIPDENGNVLLNEQKIHPLKVKNLRFADIGMNNFEIKTLPKELGYFKNLEYLWIGMRGFEELPEVVLSLNNLKIIDLQHGAIRKLPARITCLEKLEEIILLGSGIKELPMELTELDSLKILHLGLTKLCSIPDVLLELNQLEELVIINDFESDSCKRIISRKIVCDVLSNEKLKINGRLCQ